MPRSHVMLCSFVILSETKDLTHWAPGFFAVAQNDKVGDLNGKKGDLSDKVRP